MLNTSSFKFTQPLLICALLLFSPFANRADAAGGAYQRTKDGKTMVWNNNPQPGDVATWSGERDAEGYATGAGTLVWSTAQPVRSTGTNIPTTKHSTLSRYTGTMAHGKLKGAVVGVDADGSTYHGTFANGRRTKDWSAGPAPSPSPKEAKNRAMSDEKKAAAAVASPSPVVAEKRKVEQPTEKAAPAPTAAPKSETRDGSSLDSLTMPPSSLRANAEPRPAAEIAEPTPPPPSKPAGPTLTTGEAIEVADAAARAKGVNLQAYRRPQAQYIAADDGWSVFYDQKPVNGQAEIGKHFTVNVEDKTKKPSIIPGR